MTNKSNPIQRAQISIKDNIYIPKTSRDIVEIIVENDKLKIQGKDIE